MKKGYWIALYKQINNLENLKKYSTFVTPVFKKFKAKPLVRGGKYKVLSGNDFPRTVIWEFPCLEDAVKCHESKEYQDGWALAKDTTIRYLQIVEGFNIE